MKNEVESIFKNKIVQFIGNEFNFIEGFLSDKIK